MTATAVYRVRDEAGALLYIGRTSNPGKRFALHFDVRLSRVASIAEADTLRRRFDSVDFEWFPDVAAATVAERAAIRDEAPLLNRAHNTSRWRWTGRRFTATSP